MELDRSGGPGHVPGRTPGRTPGRAVGLSVGVGLKPEHFGEAMACTRAGLWFEVHAENYFVAGGPRLAGLMAVRERHPVSLHGVGLSLASDQAPAPAHLAQWRELIVRVEPVQVSEHLAWSAWQGACLPDLLPFVRTRRALRRIAANVGRAQDALGRPLAIENPTHYLRIDGHEYSEMDFLTELAQRTGCGLLVDVNNVFVSAVNLGLDAGPLIDAFPAALVREVHLAGHSPDPIHGASLLIDSHDAPVSEAVLALYRRLVRRIGARPALIERDANLPPFADLMTECDRVDECTRGSDSDPSCQAAVPRPNREVPA